MYILQHWFEVGPIGSSPLSPNRLKHAGLPVRHGVSPGALDWLISPQFN